MSKTYTVKSTKNDSPSLEEAKSLSLLVAQKILNNTLNILQSSSCVTLDTTQLKNLQEANKTVSELAKVAIMESTIQENDNPILPMITMSKEELKRIAISREE